MPRHTNSSGARTRSAIVRVAADVASVEGLDGLSIGRLASELADAYNKQGGAMTTRDNVHRMAEANKAFAHFAW